MVFVVVMKAGNMQRLAGVADVMSRAAGGAQERHYVSLLHGLDHGDITLPDAEGQRARIRARYALIILVPNRWIDIGRVLREIEQRLAAESPRTGRLVHIGEMIVGVRGAGESPHIVGDIGEGHESEVRRIFTNFVRIPEIADRKAYPIDIARHQFAQTGLAL